MVEHKRSGRRNGAVIKSALRSRDDGLRAAAEALIDRAAAARTPANRTAVKRALASKDARLRTAAQALVSRSRFMDNIAGITFHGRRDLYRACGYSRTITPQMYRSRFRRNGVAARIVTAAPKHTWRGGAEIIESDASEQSQFELAWEALERRLNVWAIFHRADILAGLGRYAIILLGTPGDLETPLESLAADSLVYLTPFSEEDAQIEKFDTDIKSPRFGLPAFYAVRRLAPSATTRVNTPEIVGRRVHYTRVLHIADSLLDDHVYGIPRLEKVWNLLDDLEKVTAGGAEAYWKRVDQGLILDLDPMVQIAKDPATGRYPQLDALKDQIDEYEHDLRRVLTTRGITATPLGSEVTSISADVDGLMALISAASEIPQRILMGSEQAKLAGTSDADNWDERVLDRRTEFAGPQVVKPFVDRLIRLGALPQPAGSWEVKWPEIKNLNENQRADIAGKWAALNKSAAQIVVTGDEIRDHCLGLDPLDTADTVVALPGKDTTPGTIEEQRIVESPIQPTTGSRWATRGGRHPAHATADRFHRPIQARSAGCARRNEGGSRRLN
jgi:hypothetical protein